MRGPLRVLLVISSVLGFASVGSAAPIIYTADPTLANFTTGVTFATLSSFGAGDVSSPYTPTAVSVSSGFRVYDGTFTAPGLPSNNWILASFTSPVSSIEVLPNIDHFGAGYDGYQYAIQGSNDLSTWTPLFDALTVTGAGEPFTLGSFTGTAPTSVNNVLTPGAGPGGDVGYEAFFNFSSAYRYYVFGASTEAIGAGNADQELSGVAAVGPTAVPEPATLVLVGSALVGFASRRRTKKH
jgi:hypothetical protein